jgi:dihydroorotate dehydrogenase (NAD+) catalytic subunit
MKIPNWPLECPIYDPSQSYFYNFTYGPFTKSLAFLKRPKTDTLFSFLGHDVHSNIGIAAGPLLNSRWIRIASRLGFDILTYKTIRSHACPGHDLPNIVYVQRKASLVAQTADQQPKDMSEITITNSFGMPSQSPDFVLQDIAHAKQVLLPHQVLIVSVVGSFGSSKNLFDDFATTASIAKQAGASVIELNLSCPNVQSQEGLMYHHLDDMFTCIRTVKKQIHSVPLIVKIGKPHSFSALKNVLTTAAKAGANAVSGLNSLSMSVIDRKGQVALSNRKTSGICGSAIRKDSLQFVRDAKNIIEQEQLDLTLIGVGGIMQPSHFADCLDQGADVAHCATAFFWDPYIAIKYHYLHNQMDASVYETST